LATTHDLRTIVAGIRELLVDMPPDPPAELRDKVLELTKIVAPAYKGTLEWNALVGEIRERMGLLVSDEPEVVAARVLPKEFTAPETFEEIVADGGVFADYLAYTRESEAPTQFHFGALLACLSAAFERRPLIGWEAAPLYPNIYALLVGPTGTRKSTAIIKAREMVQLAFPVMKGKPPRLNVLPNEGSPQGYASALRKRNFEVSTMSDGLIVASELTVLVGKDSYKSALGSWLTDWYDNMSDPWARALKGDETYELPKTYVCFVGGSNMTWLREIPEQLIKAGYMPRHLVFNAAEKRHDNANPQFDGVVREKLASTIGRALYKLPAELPVSREAGDLMTDWYMGKVSRQERGEQDDLFAAWLSRKLPHALKVACIWQMADGGPREALDVRWMRRAIKLIDWMDGGVLSVYHALGSTSEGAVTEEVLAYVQKKGGTLALSAIARGLKNKYGKRSVVDALEMLVMARMMKRVNDSQLGLVYSTIEQGVVARG
jgi:hypothetical protein